MLIKKECLTLESLTADFGAIFTVRYLCQEKKPGAAMHQMLIYDLNFVMGGNRGTRGSKC